MLTGFETVETGKLSDNEQRLARRIASRLRAGGRPVLSSAIEVAENLTDVKVRAMISWLRSLGDPELSLIGSSSKGYFWMEYDNAVIKVIESLDQRANAINIAKDGIRRAMRKRAASRAERSQTKIFEEANGN